MIYVSGGKQEYVPNVPTNERCTIKDPCFARGNLTGKCGILNPPLPTGKCSFCKPKRTVTKGVEYPDDPLYGRLGES